MKKTEPLGEREKYLADALRRMVLMHEAMISETPIEIISYSRSTRLEMGQALIHAEKALQKVGYMSPPDPAQDPDSVEAMLLAATRISGKYTHKNPVRSSVGETMRRLSDPGIQWKNQSLSAQPQRQPASQCSPLSRCHRQTFFKTLKSELIWRTVFQTGRMPK